jgi:hypothetical protein
MTETATTGPVALDEVLAYRHYGVINRYCKVHHASPAEAEELFQETLKWLYLCYRSQTGGPADFACTMFADTQRIDWMWHVFILFTRDYAAFCDRYFGFFLHHVPEEAESPEPIDEATWRSHLDQQYGLVHDVLGAETLTRWYGECRYAAAGSGSQR